MDSSVMLRQVKQSRERCRELLRQYERLERQFCLLVAYASERLGYPGDDAFMEDFQRHLYRQGLGDEVSGW